MASQKLYNMFLIIVVFIINKTSMKKIKINGVLGHLLCIGLTGPGEQMTSCVSSRRKCDC